MTLRQNLLKLASKDLRIRRVLQRELRRTANLPNATVGMFIEVLSSKLTQWDKRYNKTNPYALAHYLDAVSKLRDFLSQDLKSQDPESLLKLKKALLSERFLFKDFGPVKATLKQIDQFLAQGTMPSLTRRASQRDLAWWQGESGKWYVQKGGGWDKEDLYFYPTQVQKNGGVKGLLKNDVKSGQAKQISLGRMDFSVWIEIPEASVPEHVKIKIDTRKTAARRGIIGPRGLEAPMSGGITLQPNTVYWIGASSSPDMIIVTKVTDKVIEYFDPYRKTPMRIEKWIGEDLITRGCKRWLATYGQVPGWKTYAKSIASMLSGGPGKKEKLSDWERVRVTVKRNPAFRGEDLWRLAESYGNVAGIEDTDGDQLYEIEGFRRSVMKVKKDPHFVVVGAKKIAFGLVPGGNFEGERSMLRIHRYMDSIQVTDLTNAGKRGKKVDEFAIYDVNYVRDEKEIDRFSGSLTRARSYREAFDIAKDWIMLQQNKGVYPYPKIQTRLLRGIDVKPAGFSEIKIETPHVSINAGHTDWVIRDKRDKINEPTCAAKSKTSVVQFFRWIKDNKRVVESMTFQEIMRALSDANIEYRYWCSVD